jgi:hypothetical protein
MPAAKRFFDPHASPVQGTFPAKPVYVKNRKLHQLFRRQQNE